jgi:hypothetical protein
VQTYSAEMAQVADRHRQHRDEKRASWGGRRRTNRSALVTRQARRGAATVASGA